ncbi:hypothetical protein LCGC14_0315680 [marine sediment metagenome]|uniref:Disease resistance R13L4/SHOC-2-like LRR domain-containing protein n=1 Tax=marine sediment metagenome TaxID=412755 RepID=A0A0F9WSM4_9ZZZZ|nr:hypothetical protein [Phycisphaerae bacterium]HDZ44589.1 hypothetical protein [Phycisphaerae bacterium]
MRYWWAWIGLVGVVLVATNCGRSAAPSVDEAIERITLLGGRIEPAEPTRASDVVAVDLSGTSIVDEELVFLRAFPKLRRLSLKGCPVSDYGMIQVGKLTMLEQLDIDKIMGITDVGMRRLSGLAKLRSLALYGGRITDAGMAHLSKLTELRSLSLRGANRVRYGFKHLPQFRHLEKLDLRGTTVWDADLPKYLGSLKTLKKLRLAWGTTDELLAALAEIPGLEELELSRTRSITEKGLDRLGRLKSLRSLRLWRMTLSEAAFERIASLPALEELKIVELKIAEGSTVEGCLKRLAGAKGLRVLHLGSRISDEAMVHLAELANLEELRGLGGIGEQGLGHLVRLKKLRRLQVSVRVSQASLRRLSAMTQLEEIRILGHTMTDADVAELAKMTHLRSVSIYSDHLTGAALASLAGLTETRSAYIGGKGITDEDLRHLAAWTELEDLSLQTSSVTGSGVRHLSGLKKLRSLRLIGGGLTDEGMVGFADLVQLESLDLAGQGINGQGLRHLAKLEQLRTLRLFRTAVNDDALKHVGALKGLRTLELHWTLVTNAGMEHLAGLEMLHALYLSETAVTEGAMADLTKAKRLRTVYMMSAGDAGLRWLLPMPLTEGEWVTSADGVLSLRLLAPTEDVRPAEPIVLIAEMRNNSDHPVRVLRPFGDSYRAMLGMTIIGPKGEVTYTGDTPSYALGSGAFAVLPPGESIRDRMVLKVHAFAGSSAPGKYEITYRYLVGSDIRGASATVAPKAIDPWQGEIQTQPIHVVKRK